MRSHGTPAQKAASNARRKALRELAVSAGLCRICKRHPIDTEMFMNKKVNTCAPCRGVSEYGH